MCTVCVHVCVWPDDLILFLSRCARGLRDGGVVIVKENCTRDACFIVDDEDGSVTR